MTLHALLVSKDDYAAEVLSRALANFGVAVERFSESEIALHRLGEQRFDNVIVDFDEPEIANQILKAALRPEAGTLITIGLLSEAMRVREVLKAGAKFILHKPVTGEHATVTLRAVTALLRRERR